jgi:hypothetical protein
MTWREAAASLQLAAEERHGAPTRARLMAAYKAEQDAAEQSKEAVSE